MKKKRILIVGAGLSGLTAGAYLLRAGHSVRILEKSSQCGGLLSSFETDGFVFDTGPRALGNAGILRSMLEDLGIELELMDSKVSLGIADEIVHFDTGRGIPEYLAALNRLFPGSETEIR
ncbi:MAG: phytoene desaturase family protein, partial [Spirochaetia bacterium]